MCVALREDRRRDVTASRRATSPPGSSSARRCAPSPTAAWSGWSARATRPPSRRSSAASGRPLSASRPRSSPPAPRTSRRTRSPRHCSRCATPTRRSSCGPGSSGSSAIQPSTTCATGRRPPRSSRRPCRAARAPRLRPSAREELAELMERLRALPEPQRAAIVMRELEGLSHEEIAAALGVSGGAARQAIYRAGRPCATGRPADSAAVPPRADRPRGRGDRLGAAARGGAPRRAAALWAGPARAAPSRPGVVTALLAGSVGAAGLALAAGRRGPRAGRSPAAVGGRRRLRGERRSAVATAGGIVRPGEGGGHGRRRGRVKRRQRRPVNGTTREGRQQRPRIRRGPAR